MVEWFCVRSCINSRVLSLGWSILFSGPTTSRPVSASAQRSPVGSCHHLRDCPVSSCSGSVRYGSTWEGLTESLSAMKENSTMKDNSARHLGHTSPRRLIKGLEDHGHLESATSTSPFSLTVHFSILRDSNNPGYSAINNSFSQTLRPVRQTPWHDFSFLSPRYWLWPRSSRLNLWCPLNRQLRSSS